MAGAVKRFMATQSSHNSPTSGNKFAVFLDKRVASIFLLGIAQGLPWVMIGSMLTIWLQESGISRTKIGFAALIFTVYAINFLWSPVIEIFKPRLLPKLGHRQSWILLCLMAIGMCCFIIGTMPAQLNPSNVVFIALLIAIFSSTQDIAIDAYRVDSFSPHESDKISAAAGAATSGWWTGYAGIGALPLFLSDQGWHWPDLYVLLGLIAVCLGIANVFLPNTKISHSRAQEDTYLGVLAQVTSANSGIKRRIAFYACALLVSITVILLSFFQLLPSSAVLLTGFTCVALAAVGLLSLHITRLNNTHSASLPGSTGTSFEKTLAWTLTALIAPIQEFFSRNGLKLAFALLSFIFLFKVGEAFLGRMSVVFYKEIGFSNSQIATYAKLMTWWLTIIFSVVGAIVNARFGLVKGLFISGIAMASTNLLFSLLALTGPSTKIFALAIILDGFSQAWSTVAFVAFISIMCNHAFSATQYALMASLGNLGRTTLASTSGYFVDILDGNWALFFAVTTFMVIPSLIILWRLRPFIHTIAANAQKPHSVGT